MKKTILSAMAVVVVAVVARGSCGFGSGPFARLGWTGAAAQNLPVVTLDRTTTYQTISGWEATAQAGQDDSKAFPIYSGELFDLAVNDFGITRLRLGVRSGAENPRDGWSEYKNGQIDEATWRSLRYSTVNDNRDPFVLNPRGFNFSDLDDHIERVVLPMKERIEASGQKLWLNVNYTAFTSQIGKGLQYDHDNPEEYAEFVQAVYQHIKDTFDLVPDAWEILLEPDNGQANGRWQPAAMRDAMAAAGRRLQAMGITPRFIAPSTTNMANALTYTEELARKDRSPFWRELAYHRYAGVSVSTLQRIADRAQQLGLDTAMLEHIGAGYETLHQDLKIGRNSAWQQFTLAFPGDGQDGSSYYAIDDKDPEHPRVSLSVPARGLRQYFRYIRPGAVRIGAASDDEDTDPLAFVNTDGKYVVVVKRGTGGSFTVSGLAPGSYGVTYTTARETDVARSPFDVVPGATMTLGIPEKGVVTVFQR